MLWPNQSSGYLYSEAWSIIIKEENKMELEFYDVKSKSKFKTDNYEVREKEAKGRTRFFAVAKSPSGSHECWRVLSKDQAEKLK